MFDVSYSVHFAGFFLQKKEKKNEATYYFVIAILYRQLNSVLPTAVIKTRKITLNSPFYFNIAHH